MRRLATILLLCCCSLLAKSQYNDTITHHIRLSATGNLNRTNAASSYLLANEARFGLRNKRSTFNAAANWLYGEQQHTLTNNDFFISTDLNLFHDSSRLYYWALANYTSSYSLKVNSQLQSGVGAAYNFVNTDSTWLNLSEGILYETSDLSTGQPESNRYHTFRNSLRLSFKFIIGGKVTFSGTNFLQQAFGDGSDYIVRATNSISVQLNKWMSLATSVNYNRYNRTGRENLLFTYGIILDRFY